MTLQTITILRECIVTLPEIIQVQSVKFVNPTHDLDSLLCSACHKPIGPSRPVAVAYRRDCGYRLCHNCSKDLKETETVYND
jgi:hypothetical protein